MHVNRMFGQGACLYNQYTISGLVIRWMKHPAVPQLWAATQHFTCSKHARLSTGLPCTGLPCRARSYMLGVGDHLQHETT